MGITIICIAFVLYFSLTSEIVSIENGYGRFDRDYQLQNQEILYGSLYCHKRGAIPIQIKKVSLINKQNISVELKGFLCKRQGMQMTGGPIKLNTFNKYYGENLLSIKELEEMSLNEDFGIVVLTKENQLAKIWIEIEYTVFGIIHKKQCSSELII